jgi:hypothetical protein
MMEHGEMGPGGHGGDPYNEGGSGGYDPYNEGGHHDPYNQGGSGYGPQLYTQAICCMPGMDCWGPQYEGTQGRESLQHELDMLNSEYPEARARFDELNRENLEKLAIERQSQFAEADTNNRLLTRSVTTAETQKANLLNRQAGTEGTPEYDDLQVEIDALTLNITNMIQERDTIQEEYARLNKEDAKDAITMRNQDLVEIDRIITERRAEAEW